MPVSELSIKTKDALKFDCYVAKPAKTNAPAIIVIQEIFGVNKWLRSVADWIAENGYYAIAPDLFHRQEKGIQLTDKTEAEWARAFELYNGFNEELGVKDLIDTLETVRKMPDCSGKVGTMGFCLGGKLAYLMSTRSNSDANVSYYGVGIENNLDETVQKPLLMHIAEADKYVPPDAQKNFREKLGSNSLVELQFYPGLDHAFGRVGGEHYDEAGAKKAHDRTLAFFKEKLA